MYNVREINNKFDKINPYLNLWEYSIDPKDLTIQQKLKQAFFKGQTSERFNHYSHSTHKSTFKK